MAKSNKLVQDSLKGKPPEELKDATREQQITYIQRKSIVPEKDRQIITSQPFGYNIKLSELEAEDLVKNIKTNRDLIKQKRQEYGLEDKWRELRDLYDGEMKKRVYTYESASNLHIHVTSMMCDIIRVKTAQNMYVRPMMLVKPVPGVAYEGNLYENLELKESFMDFKLREELDLEEIEAPIIDDATILGTGILKCIYIRETDKVRELMIYEGKKDREKFMLDFQSNSDDPEVKKALRKLELDQKVELWVDYNKITYDGVKLNYVALQDLEVRPDIPDIDKQPMVHEVFTKTWSELTNLAANGFFSKEVVYKLKERYPTEYFKKLYKVVETICTQTYYDEDKDTPTKSPRKLVCTFIDEEAGLDFLRVISFPYKHNSAYYIPFYIKRDPSSFYGYSLAEKLKPINELLNNLWNDTVDGSLLRNAPMFKAKKDAGFDPSMKKLQPAIIMWLDDMKSLETLNVGGISPEMFNLISRAERYAEWISGVTAYMTGRESPTDPTAPMGKAFLLLKESNLRVNDFIKSLHRGNKRLFKQAEALMYQYDVSRDVYKTEDGTPVKKTITKRILGMPCQYIPQMADIATNKELEREQDSAFAAELFKVPGIVGNNGAVSTILDILIRNRGEKWEKQKDKILAGLKALPPTVPGAGAGAPPPPPGAGSQLPPGVTNPMDMIRPKQPQNGNINPAVAQLPEELQ